MEELGITAGLQDRVIQAFGGFVFMDFSENLMKRDGHGSYERLDITKLTASKPFWLAYCAISKDSGKVHSNVRQRWLQGDEEVNEGTQTLFILQQYLLLSIF